jgi:hypothetical protein
MALQARACWRPIGARLVSVAIYRRVAEDAEDFRGEGKSILGFQGHFAMKTRLTKKTI